MLGQAGLERSKTSNASYALTTGDLILKPILPLKYHSSYCASGCQPDTEPCTKKDARLSLV